MRLPTDPGDCRHPATVPHPCGDRVCLDCGEAILPTGEHQPALLPAEARAEALKLAGKVKTRRKAEGLLNLSLF